MPNWFQNSIIGDEKLAIMILLFRLILSIDLLEHSFVGPNNSYGVDII